MFKSTTGWIVTFDISPKLGWQHGCNTVSHGYSRSSRAHTAICARRSGVLPSVAKHRRAREAAGQLRRAANSLRSNYRSARKGRSRAEFQAKLGTAAEEADECLDWLEYFRDGRIRSDPQLIEEARELTKILAASMKTSRANTNRMKELPKS